MVDRTVVAPPQIAGATFVGTKECSQCHEDVAGHFDTATHAKLAFADAKVGSTGCEACHGPGSLHVKSGGGRGTIINPEKSPETCFQCHNDKQGEFSLPNSHAVMHGKMSCSDCHEPHKGNALKGHGATLEAETETCTKCHTSQKGPFIFKHNAMKEGCTSCHNPHGSVNQKMLVSPDANLCLRCHATVSTTHAINAGDRDHRANIQNGTCWGQGCHEAVHGSNSSEALRY
ncbi:cytochrome c3 family protein [Opitutus sp. ER46]|uniref:cytochrome c3 family protein n=1 Tax=Opitutus sp. ER46 TaxID=2161864 RepID=UPI001304C34F|nr:cytochrome c3 family protein [Opitutus sp. ER46]